MSPTREKYIEDLKTKYKKTGFITTHLMLDAILNNQQNTLEDWSKELIKVRDNLQILVDRFNKDCCPAILAKNEYETRYTTFRFATEEIEFISRVTAGRILMTVSPTKEDYRFVSLIAADSRGECGLQGLGAKEKDAYWLMEKLLDTFNIDKYEVYTSDGVHIV
jgi:hypothetical protein